MPWSSEKSFSFKPFAHPLNSEILASPFQLQLLSPASLSNYEASPPKEKRGLTQGHKSWLTAAITVTTQMWVSTDTGHGNILVCTLLKGNTGLSRTLPQTGNSIFVSKQSWEAESSLCISLRANLLSFLSCSLLIFTCIDSPDLAALAAHCCCRLTV